LALTKHKYIKLKDRTLHNPVLNYSSNEIDFVLANETSNTKTVTVKLFNFALANHWFLIFSDFLSKNEFESMILDQDIGANWETGLSLSTLITKANNIANLINSYDPGRLPVFASDHTFVESDFVLNIPLNYEFSLSSVRFYSEQDYIIGNLFGTYKQILKQIKNLALTNDGYDKPEYYVGWKWKELYDFSFEDRQYLDVTNVFGRMYLGIANFLPAFITRVFAAHRAAGINPNASYFNDTNISPDTNFTQEECDKIGWVNSFNFDFNINFGATTSKKAALEWWITLKNFYKANADKLDGMTWEDVENRIGQIGIGDVTSIDGVTVRTAPDQILSTADETSIKNSLEGYYKLVSITTR
jgi:hypothetical protein